VLVSWENFHYIHPCGKSGPTTRGKYRIILEVEVLELRGDVVGVYGTSVLGLSITN
jgi:hypothetical protein